jgi:hypothetical protein
LGYEKRIFFTSKDDGPSIEECIQNCKSSWKEKWKFCLHHYFKDDAHIWWKSFDFCEWRLLFDEALEKLLLYKWSHVKNTERPKGLFFHANSILHVHGCIHKENVIVFINPSCQQIFINVQLVNRLQVPTKSIQSTHVASENVQIFKDLKFTMTKYVLHSNFYPIDMDDLDIILGYPWI